MGWYRHAVGVNAEDESKLLFWNTYLGTGSTELVFFVDVEQTDSSTEQSGLVWDLMVALWGRVPHIDPDGKLHLLMLHPARLIQRDVDEFVNGGQLI